MSNLPLKIHFSVDLSQFQIQKIGTSKNTDFFFRCAAKFLWKRIPESIKADHPELQKIWSVGMALWERNLPEAYAALNQTWSEGVSSIMKAVKGTTYTISLKLT